MVDMQDDVQERAKQEAQRAGLDLVETEHGLTLVDPTRNMSLCPDFGHMCNRIRPDALNRELLVRAAKVRTDDGRRDAIDATAGLGEDSFLLAAAGFDVKLVERNPVIAALLRDALVRARTDDALRQVAAHMQVIEADSVVVLGQLALAPDVVMLDPMFPTKTKSAAVKKKLQLLQMLERPCDDETALLDAAIAANPRKIVVKRPVKGPHLAGRTPSYTLTGKAIRYDCYVL